MNNDCHILLRTNPDLRGKFKECCTAKNTNMTSAINDFMTQVVAGELSLQKSRIVTNCAQGKDQP